MRVDTQEPAGSTEEKFPQDSTQINGGIHKSIYSYLNIAFVKALNIYAKVWMHHLNDLKLCILWDTVLMYTLGLLGFTWRTDFFEVRFDIKSRNKRSCTPSHLLPRLILRDPSNHQPSICAVVNSTPHSVLRLFRITILLRFIFIASIIMRSTIFTVLSALLLATEGSAFMVSPNHQMAATTRVYSTSLLMSDGVKKTGTVKW